MSSALVIIDVQKTWSDKNPLTAQRINAAAASLRSRMSIVWIYMNSEGPVQPFTTARPGAVRRAFSQLPSGYKPTFYPAPGDFMGTKAHPNGFANTDLEEFLLDRNMIELYFAGFRATQCVQVTAISASRKEFNAHIVTDLSSDERDADPLFANEPDRAYLQVSNSSYRVNLLTSKDMGLNLA